jgi:zinc transporter 1
LGNGHSILFIFAVVQEASMILLQTVPTHINMDELKRKLRETVPGILGIHEFHVWQLAGDRVIASIHIV